MNMDLFQYDKHNYRWYYCRICGRKIKHNEPKMTLYIHQRSIAICLDHFNKDMLDKIMVEEL